MALVNLKTTKQEKKDREKGMAVAIGPTDDYPYGLRLDLDDSTLKKLGITKLPAVGAKLMFEAQATVVGSRQSANSQTSTRSLELQVTAIDLEVGEQDEEAGEGELTRDQAGPMSKVAAKMRGM